MAIDWAIDATGIWANIPSSRVATGLVFGVVAGYVFARALAIPTPAPARLVPVPTEPATISHPTPSAYA